MGAGTLTALVALVLPPARAAEPRSPFVVPAQPPRDKVDQFKRLVGARNIGEFELQWRRYIELLYDREFRKDGPHRPRVAPLAADGGEALDWPFDRLYLVGEKTPILGLIRGEDATEVNFQEVCRPAGQGLSMKGRHIKLEHIERREELSAADRKRLEKLIQEFAERHEAERKEQENIVFGTRKDDFNRVLSTYRGSNFEFESTADEETRRSSIVRIEQRMEAYRRLIPPTRQPQRPLKILLLGSVAEYKTFLAQARLEVPGPAFYSPEQNLVVAYSERDVVVQKFKQAQLANKQMEATLKESKNALQEHQAKVAKEFQKKGATQKEITRVLAQLKAEQQREIDRIDRELEECTRRNERSMEDYIEQTYRVLYHEAFHAYLESYVADHQQVPRWLNEGLAQVVENGRLESRQLRIDAPDRERLKRLYDDLHRPDPLTLVGLLEAQPEQFLGIHAARQAAGADRYYLYSWGLAYYLAFEMRALGTKTLDAYVSPGGIPAKPQATPTSAPNAPADVE